MVIFVEFGLQTSHAAHLIEAGAVSWISKLLEHSILLDAESLDALLKLVHFDLLLELGEALRDGHRHPEDGRQHGKEHRDLGTHSRWFRGGEDRPFV